MKKISILKNTIQEYKWGSYSAIPELLGKPASAIPQAEVWMGAHPKAPSEIQYKGQWIGLDKIIQKNPEEILGKSIAEKFNNQMPYLFKILAAASPLSIQAHPSLEQAKKGYENENRLNIPFNAANRNYKDDNHKPECICALTPFWALNGFRNIYDTISLIKKACPRTMINICRNLEQQQNTAGLKQFFHDLMNADQKAKEKMINEALENAQIFSDDSPVFQWIIKLHQVYPLDIGVLSPLFLNLIYLDTGKAMFLPAGELHSYLDGVGIELMANSDNVLRGGLTPKHVDVDELLNVLNFAPKEIQIFSPKKRSAYEWFYPCEADEFILSVISIQEDIKSVDFINNNIQILFCTQGNVTFIVPEINQKLNIAKGVSVLIPASINKYEIYGTGVIYKACVP